MVTDFFAGANSGNGFRTLFPELVNLEETYDFMVLKGGPGVGKNTFMRVIGTEMEKAGTAVEYLWCSGDPDSLDGIVLPEIRCAIADGTAPHTIEPTYPAAVDRYVDLGRFYDLNAAKADAQEVKRHTKAYKEAYKRAYRYLKAAREIELASIAEVQDTFQADRLERRIRGILQRELRQKGTETGRTTRRFLGSLTHQGFVWRFDSIAALCPRIYELEDRWELAGEYLERLHIAAKTNHWDTILCMAPEDPMRIEHLLIPGLGVAFVSSRAGMTLGMRPYRRIRLDAMVTPEKKSRLRLQSRMVGMLRAEAVNALKEAKTNHDRLEGVYNPYVDFEGVRALAALEAGRLLNYLQREREKG